MSKNKLVKCSNCQLPETYETIEFDKAGSCNICEGVRNNVFGTLAVAKASINKKIKNLVLISSDKAEDLLILWVLLKD